MFLRMGNNRDCLQGVGTHIYRKEKGCLGKNISSMREGPKSGSTFAPHWLAKSLEHKRTPTRSVECTEASALRSSRGNPQLCGKEDQGAQSTQPLYGMNRGGGLFEQIPKCSKKRWPQTVAK